MQNISIVNETSHIVEAEEYALSGSIVCGSIVMFLGWMIEEMMKNSNQICE